MPSRSRRSPTCRCVSCRQNTSARLCRSDSWSGSALVLPGCGWSAAPTTGRRRPRSSHHDTDGVGDPAGDSVHGCGRVRPGLPEEVGPGRRLGAGLAGPRRRIFPVGGAALHGRAAAARRQHGLPDRQPELRRRHGSIKMAAPRARDEHAMAGGRPHPDRCDTGGGARVSLSASFLASEAEIPPALWERCFPPPLEGRWWYRALEACGLDDQFTFLYALIHDAERPIGIAPAFLGTAPILLAVPAPLQRTFAFWAKFMPSLLQPRTLFVGSPCADEGTVGLLPGTDRRAAFECLQQAVEGEARRRDLHMIAWKDFPGSDADDIAWLQARHGLFRMVSFPGTIVSLPGPRKDDYFAALKGSRRGQLKKKIRHSAAHVDVEAEAIQHPSPA